MKILAIGIILVSGFGAAVVDFFTNGERYVGGPLIWFLGAMGGLVAGLLLG